MLAAGVATALVRAGDDGPPTAAPQPTPTATSSPSPSPTPTGTAATTTPSPTQTATPASPSPSPTPTRDADDLADDDNVAPLPATGAPSGLLGMLWIVAALTLGRAVRSG